MSRLFTNGDNACKDCNGDGAQRDWIKEGYPTTGQPCRECRGTGLNLNDFGREIVDLLVEGFGLTPKAQR